MRSSRRSERSAPRSLALACVGAAAFACVTPPDAARPPADAASEGSAPRAPPPVTANMVTRYRGRFTGDSSDHDVEQSAEVTFADPAGRYSGSVFGRALLDLDGDSGAEFFGLMDTYDHRLQAQLFHAYIDVASRAFELLRFGRQPLYETPVTVLLDGVRAESVPSGQQHVQFGAYAGSGEHPYESSPQGDFVFGGFGAAHAWEGAEVRADWMHLADARLGVDHENDLFGLVLHQDLTHAEAFSRMEARFTSLEGNGRDVRVLASTTDADARWSVSGSVYRLLQTQKSLAAPLDPFSDTLFELFPYTQLGLSATRDWSHFALLSGADLRRVSHAQDEGEFNHEFDRYYVTGTLPDALPVSLSLTGELWDADDTDIQTWGAMIEHAFDGGFEVSLGSHYELYEYDLLNAEERDHVRSTQLDLHWRKGARRWTLGYEFERNDFDDFHQVRLDYAWGF